MEALRQEINKMVKGQIPVQTQWVSVDSVDWDAKTMTCTDVSNGLQFFKVPLSLGSFTKKPVVGTKALVGLVENQGAAAYMIDCQAFEVLLIELENGFKIELKADGTGEINGATKGGLAIAGNIKREIDKLNSNMSILKTATNTALVAIDALIPGTSAAFAAAVATMQPIVSSDFENENVKHG